jgi:transposase
MGRIKTWEISDAFWVIVEPLIPTKLEKNMPASRAVAENQSIRTDSFSPR